MAELAWGNHRHGYYDSAPLIDTLEELVDFSMINDKAVRFSVGAVNILSAISSISTTLTKP